MRHDYASELYEMFCKEKVLDMQSISNAFPGRSRISLVRDLRKIGAISSCNHRGCHYTIKMAAVFDKHGLWRHSDALFSTHGNLKCTIRSMVNNSCAGMTHNELDEILCLRTHNTLREMVDDGEIDRVNVHGAYVYICSDTAAGLAQLGERAKPEYRRKQAARTAPEMIIEVLSYVIRQPQATAADAHARFAGRGMSRAAIESIFESYVYADGSKKN